MDSLVGKIVLAIAIAFGIGLAQIIMRKRSRKLATEVEPLLRERGAQTLPELAAALGMGGFFSRGKVVMALNEMIAGGQVEMIDAPPGTPQLQKVNHIRYRLRS